MAATPPLLGLRGDCFISPRGVWVNESIPLSFDFDRRIRFCDRQTCDRLPYYTTKMAIRTEQISKICIFCAIAQKRARFSDCGGRFNVHFAKTQTI